MPITDFLQTTHIFKLQPTFTTNKQQTMCSGNRWYPMCACTADQCPRADTMGASGNIRGHHVGQGWPDLMSHGYWLCPDYVNNHSPDDKTPLAGPQMKSPPSCPGFRWLEVKMDSKGKMCADCRNSRICGPIIAAAAKVKQDRASKKPAWRP